jgi:holo-[acyl-carrier protein] synthase
MLLGVGIDAANLSRFQKLWLNERFIKRVLTETEIYDFKNSKNKANFLAKRFSAKEAFAKALGSGIGERFSFKSIEILKNSNNAPFINILDDSLKTIVKRGLISFSDEKIGQDILISCVVVLEGF